MKKNDTDLTLDVIARSPFEVHYEGPALAVSASNKVGSFDILPAHADFFSMLEACEVVIRTENEPISIQIHNGILTVRDNKVMLFVNM